MRAVDTSRPLRVIATRSPAGEHLLQPVGDVKHGGAALAAAA